MRQRVVEEYRGRRIMTDGRRFGVEAPDGVDLRYVTSRDARKEIDSELGAAEYRRTRGVGRLWLVVPDDFPIACSCGGEPPTSGINRRPRRNEPDWEPESDAVIAFERCDGQFVRLGAVRSIAARQYTIFEEPPGHAEHRRQLEGVVATFGRTSLVDADGADESM
jgi:hypothetical protein